MCRNPERSHTGCCFFAQEIENGRPITFHAEDSSGRFKPNARRDLDPQ
jgi:hypothetical protein